MATKIEELAKKEAYLLTNKIKERVTLEKKIKRLKRLTEMFHVKTQIQMKVFEDEISRIDSELKIADFSRRDFEQEYRSKTVTESN